uniref:Poly(A) polymerase I n=1 Tax=Cucumis melo TaxID=3656 RepID=A0A9I9D6E1_CUCME
MASFSLRAHKNVSTSRLIDVIKLHRLRHAFMYPAADFHSVGRQDAASDDGLSGEIHAVKVDWMLTNIKKKGAPNGDMPKWNKVNGRVFGITRWMIPSSPRKVLEALHHEGFEAYLVGGCVRDLILDRVPKDFDVITTAGLTQVNKLFRRSRIVGRRFPICMVHIQGTITEVSSFDTTAKHSEGKEITAHSQIPKKCDKKDLIRWRNSMERDFTINSLFFDPFSNVIYDYAEGMADLRSLKLRTLIPASLSFKLDCARILRGLRIAARLGLSISKETETAIRKFSPSITSLDKFRLMMELNYMLSYGAAVPSLYLLQRFNLLEILLPFHAAYLNEQGINKSSLSSVMLMKLFFNLDKLVSCARPSNCNIWVALLAFHLALVNNPQNSLIVLAFAATLYHGEWNEGVNYARAKSLVEINLRPEITRSAEFKSENELAEGVTCFALNVQGCIAALTSADCLLEAMSTFPASSNSGLVFVSKKAARDVANIFEVLVNDVESYKDKRKNFEVDYKQLGNGGFLRENRYVLGKVILETLEGAILQGNENILDSNQNLGIDAPTKETSNSPVADLVQEQLVKKNKKVRKLPSVSEVELKANKKYKFVKEEGSISDKVRATENMRENPETMGNEVKKIVPYKKAFQKVTKELLHPVEIKPRKMDKVAGQKGKSEKKEHHRVPQGKENIKTKHRDITNIKQCKGPLSSLFK